MYDREFFELEGEVARRSAELVIPWLVEHVGVSTVIDIGCGVGAWLAVAREFGAYETYGVDGFVPRDMLLVGKIASEDLTAGYSCAGWYLAICLEVAEHLPAESAEPLVAGLAQANVVLFSAATPGQPGVGHINCQPHDYWHDLFAEHGKTPEFIGDQFGEPVADFYRRNLFLYQ